MNAKIRMNEAGLVELCVKYRVERLELFGSATGPEDAPIGDIDFLVEFYPCTPAEHCDRYFGLLAGLEELFGCRIDLVETKAMKNPYFIRRVNEQRVPVYAA